MAYRILAGAVGGLLAFAGLYMVFTFVSYQAPDSRPPFSTGPVGHYFVAFAGCAMVAWGGGLLGIARRPDEGRALATATAFALVLMAVYHMMAWVVGDYYVIFGEVLRFEAGLFLLLALAFLWLRPARASSGAAQEGA